MSLSNKYKNLKELLQIILGYVKEILIISEDNCIVIYGIGLFKNNLWFLKIKTFILISNSAALCYKA